MSQENSVLALYAAFAGFLLILLLVYKAWTDYEEKRKAPRLQFPPPRKQAKEEVHEDAIAVGGR